MKNKNILLAALVGLSSLFATFTAVAQEEAKSSPFNASVSLYSRYIWRGTNLGGDAASIQPTLTFTKGGLTAGAWGAFSLGPTTINTTGKTEYQEIDLYATYTYKMFSVTLTDYFIPYDVAKSSKYSEFGNDTTSHVGEITFSFNGIEGLPLTFLFAMNLYGYDARKANGEDLVMSKYVELGYTIDASGVPVKIFVGAAIDKPAIDGNLGYYFNKKAGLVNVGFTATKTVQVNDKFSFPLAATLGYNPDAEGILFAMGITF